VFIVLLYFVLFALSKKLTFIILFNDLSYCLHITLAVGSSFYLAFYIICFYHLL